MVTIYHGIYLLCSHIEKYSRTILHQYTIDYHQENIGINTKFNALSLSHSS